MLWPTIEYISYSDCLIELYPHVGGWCIEGDDYDSLIWPSDTSVTKPTNDVLASKKIELINNFPIERLREQRNILLGESDKYSLLDYPHTSESKKNEWITYRQSLRDLPSTTTPIITDVGELIGITWPTKPE